MWTTPLWTMSTQPLVYSINGLDWLWLGTGVLADAAAQAAGADWRRDAPFYRGP